MVSNKRISVYIVEDYLLIRKSLIHLLNKIENIDVLGDFESAELFFEAFQEKQADIVIMDLGLPGINGLDATMQIKQKYPDTKVIILTSHEKEDEVLAALAVGANAYCYKDVEPECWESLLTDVNNGVLWLHPRVSSVVNRAIPQPISTEFGNLYEKADENLILTDREKETLALVVQGKTNTEIAELLHISSHTAKAHVGSLLSKLAVTDRVQAAVKAVRTRLVD